VACARAVHEKGAGMPTYGTNLSDMQRDALDRLTDVEWREQVRERLIAGNAPHPFDQVRMLSLRQRLCGLPKAAQDRALAHPEHADRYTGITASSILGSSHNFSSGGYFFNAYAEQFGHRAQLGLVVDENGSSSSYCGWTSGMSGRWVRIQPLGIHSAMQWAFVWADPTWTNMSGIGFRKPHGLALDARKVPVVVRMQAYSGGELIGTGSVQDMPHRARQHAETIRESFAARGVPNVVVTYHVA
jgi:hypothetical protein